MPEKKQTMTEKTRAAKTNRYPGLTRPFEELERWYEDFFPRLSALRGNWPAVAQDSPFFAHRIPAVDIIEHDNEVIVRAEVPGVRKEDVKVSLSHGAMTIQGHTQHEEEEKRDDYFRREMTYGDFRRTFALPADVDTTKARAKIQDGVLEIQLPKMEGAKSREVNVEIH